MSTTYDGSSASHGEMSEVGTKRTSRPGLTMSVHRGGAGSPRAPSLTKATLAATRDHPLYDMHEHEEADYQLHEMEERDAEHDA